MRPARVEDAPAMGHVLVATWLEAHRDHVPEAVWQRRVEEWTPAVSAAGWSRAIAAIESGRAPGECVLLAVEGDEIVGIAMGRPEADAGSTGEVPSLYVATARHGEGIGRQLLGAVATFLAGHGITSLHVGVLASNTPARRFYERLGGRVVAERAFDEHGLPLRELVYRWDDIGTLTG